MRRRKNRFSRLPLLIIPAVLILVVISAVFMLRPNIESTSGNEPVITQAEPPTEETGVPEDEPSVQSPETGAAPAPEASDAEENTEQELLTNAGLAPAPAQEPETTPMTGDGDKPLLGAVIGIDPGHQGRGNNELEPSAPDSDVMKAKVSSGTRGVASNVAEHIVNLEVALILKERLVELGADVLMVRETADVDISNVQRATMMNEAGVDLCIRIHANGSADGGVSGAMMLIPGEMSVSGLEESSRAAGEIIFESFLEATGAKNAGVIVRGDLTGFNWSLVPVCLIEMGFMTNPQEDLLLTSPEYQEKCASGLADGISKWWASITN